MSQNHLELPLLTASDREPQQEEKKPSLAQQTVFFKGHPPAAVLTSFLNTADTLNFAAASRDSRDNLSDTPVRLGIALNKLLALCAGSIVLDKKQQQQFIQLLQQLGDSFNRLSHNKVQQLHELLTSYLPELDISEQSFRRSRQGRAPQVCNAIIGVGLAGLTTTGILHSQGKADGESLFNAYFLSAALVLAGAVVRGLVHKYNVYLADLNASRNLYNKALSAIGDLQHDDKLAITLPP